MWQLKDHREQVNLNISAIADYILDDKSILILSDTREALDVVENKINDTLNKVREKYSPKPNIKTWENGKYL